MHVTKESFHNRYPPIVYIALSGQYDGRNRMDEWIATLDANVRCVCYRLVLILLWMPTTHSEDSIPIIIN